MIGVLILMSLTQLEDLPLFSSITAFQDRAAVTETIRILEANPQALDRFRGYDNFLDTHPSLLLTEQSKFKMLPHESYRALASSFETELFGSTANMDRFMNYLYASDTDPALSQALDRLALSKSRRKTSRKEFLLGVQYLQTHPEDAAIFLNRPHLLQPQPQDLQPLRKLFRSEHTLQENLSGRFADIQASSAASAFIQPWWDLAYDNGNPLGRAHIELESYLLKNPQRYQTWTRWNQAWSSHPKEWAWATYLHADLAARTSTPSGYSSFLSAYFDQPELRESLQSRWERQFGPPSTFPPDTDPPAIPVATTTLPSIDHPKIQRDGIVKPGQPANPRIPKPIAPRRPVRPTPPKPTVPIAPSAIENPSK